MSASSAPTSAAHSGTGRATQVEGAGWVRFAGILLMIRGTMNVIYGIGAIDTANVFVGDARYVFADLSTWGWFLVVIGAIQFLAAFSIWNGTQWGRWVGIFSAAANACLQLLWLPAFPFLALALFTMAILVIYALISYGGQKRPI